MNTTPGTGGLQTSPRRGTLPFAHLTAPSGDAGRSG